MATFSKKSRLPIRSGVIQYYHSTSDQLLIRPNKLCKSLRPGSEKKRNVISRLSTKTMGSIVKSRKGQFKAKPSAMRSGRKKQMKNLRLLTIPQEHKFFDTAVDFLFDATLEVPATGQWALIPQGDTQSTRDGRQARITSIHFRGQWIVAGQNIGLQPSYLWVVQDTQANGAAAAATDVMSSAVPQSCFRNLNNNKRFKILKKMQISSVTETMNSSIAAFGSGSIGTNTYSH